MNESQTKDDEQTLDRRIGVAILLVVTLVILGAVSYLIIKQQFKNQLPIPSAPIIGVEEPDPNDPTGPTPEPPAYVPVTVDDSAFTPAGLVEAVSANNTFALKMYNDLLLGQESSNLFFSPYSISSALAMTFEGAKGETADEIAGVFGFNRADPVRRSAMAKLYNQLNQADMPYKLYTANALWAQKDYAFLPSYTDTIARYYGGNASNVDYKNDTEGARQIINNWVADRTEQKIKNLLDPNSLTPATRLVLTNTIYFKGDWLTQFDIKQTQDENFVIGKNREVKVPLMHNAGANTEYRYVDNDVAQILELPYQGEKLSMLVVLPKAVKEQANDVTLSNLEKNLTSEQILGWINGLSYRAVDVYLPRFKMETKYTLNENLQTLGMRKAFSGGADFSGMDGTKDLLIDLVIHQAFVEVNEEGTEATGATAVSMISGSMLEPEPTPVFRADRPFLFLIRENETGVILFIGRLLDPTTK